MQIITTREFRANQKKYFELAEQETILVSRKNARPIKLVPVVDDTLMTKQEFFAQIDRAMEDVKAGRTYCMLENESIDDFLTRMIQEGNV